MRLASIVAICVLSICALGCDSHRRVEQVAGYPRDSAGISIYESEKPQWQAGRAWHVTSEPAVNLGSEDGSDENNLHDVRGAIRLGDGSVVVADGGSFRVKRFDRRGSLEGNFGGRGAGPTEFQDLNWIGLYRGDSVAVFDQVNSRLTILSSGLEVGRTMGLTHLNGRLAPRGTNEAGEFLLYDPWVSRRPTHMPEWDSTVVVLISADGETTDTLGRIPKTVVQATESGRPELLRPIGSMEPYEEGFLQWRSDTYELRGFDRRGRLTKILRRNLKTGPMSDDEWSDFTESYVEQQAGSGEAAGVNAIARRIREGLREATPPDSRPIVNRVLVDEDGNIWIQESPVYLLRTPPGPQRWAVFNSEGDWMGTVDLPARLYVHQIGRDFVLGRHSDELGVERVQLYEIRKQ